MYDDFAWTRLTTPPLTVIAQPVYDMGAAAADALIRQIEGRPPRAARPEFSAKLIRRGSVGAAPATAPARRRGRWQLRPCKGPASSHSPFTPKF